MNQLQVVSFVIRFYPLRTQQTTNACLAYLESMVMTLLSSVCSVIHLALLVQDRDMINASHAISLINFIARQTTPAQNA